MKQLILFQKVEDFKNYLFQALEHFPKKEKFALTSQIKNTVYSIVKLIVLFRKSQNKRKYLFEIDIELEFLRFLIRDAYQRRFFNAKKYGTVSNCLVEIGKILGGLIKNLKG